MAAEAELCRESSGFLDADSALSRAGMKAGRAMDKGDADAALVDLVKGPDRAANIEGEYRPRTWHLPRAPFGCVHQP